MLQNLINHIVFVVDRSGSMSHLRNDVVKVFDAQVEYLAKRSKELNQETRASVYLFDTKPECLVYDMDVMRLPSLKGHYHADGGTALLDATDTAINELKQTAQLHGDHAFLIYVLTDGEENSSRFVNATTIRTKINTLPDNWTLGVLVPDANGTHNAMQYGFSDNNIQIWDTTSAKGLSEAGEAIRRSTETFMANRSKGIRGTRSLFKTIDVADISAKVVKNVLDELKPSQYRILSVTKDSAIREFVENKLGSYTKGSAFYQLTKTEEVQDYKEIAIQNLNTNKVYSGDNARKLLGLPNTTVKVKPGDFGDYEVFVQSTSVNRKLLGGTKVLVLT